MHPKLGSVDTFLVFFCTKSKKLLFHLHWLHCNTMCIVWNDMTNMRFVRWSASLPVSFKLYWEAREGVRVKILCHVYNSTLLEITNVLVFLFISHYADTTVKCQEHSQTLCPADAVQCILSGGWGWRTVAWLHQVSTQKTECAVALCFVDCEVIQNAKVRIGRVHLLLHYSWNHGSAAFAVLDTKSHTGCNNAWSPAREKWMTLGDTRVVVTTWCSTQLLFLNLMLTSIKQHDNMINSHQDQQCTTPR